MAKAFGKSGAYALGLIFLNPIFMCILGFDSSVYAYGTNRTVNQANQVASREDALAALRAKKQNQDR